jgi:YspA, cpYpsA-related SLOG family
MADGSYRILVTGSREFDAAPLLAYRLGLAVGYGLTRGMQVTVMHGANPRGADRLADMIASAHEGIGTDPHAADWDAPCRPECKPGHRKSHGSRDWCPAAGNYRNQEMVDAHPDVVLAFFKNGATNTGTSDCVRRAESAGLPVRRFTA